MSLSDLKPVIERAFENRDQINAQTKGEVRDAVNEALNALDSGKARVAEKFQGSWEVHQWLKMAVLLSFRLNDMSTIAGGPGENTNWWDKVPSKFEGWGEAEFRKAGFRAVPGAIVRRSAYIAPNVVLMPSFVNLGAHVDEGTMVDTWVTVGSCAQIGKNCHLSGGVGIGGVLEPLQANPVIIEDNCFIGARSEVVEGVIVGEGAVLSMGVFISASTKIIDRATGEVHIGKVPPYSVVVPGSLPGKANPDGSPAPSLYCCVIVKTVDAQTRAKTAINELLRD
ncbi:2,3,4,5-tetrahydropyridine-2,6-dicarboxylate N-succinyltransferase [Parvibaculum lavamentivorans DS-1]|uniref:2,3,4,5-tetrahydropyridine-2,6-dicarboxylate N-succinyltransferase n=1 Tax=Parvibaculum lavamentivorans (strain DS-1 / DSM 13023 / NCIMB 13966) TaxID=402881 RepID=DAPD_PARL1|nr:2,3,4,5-tetrahydropyridine-2,6-dicarboxylate N-succinyltransferase [Parvibaculum lavamentivorans]A7HPQ7.1 RecName: Full=2,3,4,5-tetrahydropyridine-2,6-dicarboxylate N-succinyltransferase; AltName: Full=Tetrahydrodipicolinate N-succinyltransferase; Short=THDP succinyltransferase; Short=THP succinyltransferase; Short=Tetrahydropicolinate succinylase [Parvibaculum lavamentivorans DS-1]ABS61890.1 2,3,4,5-tetrahydropyridine-2,6-dicarboxylate N-succinyltransferase [Parvibaculum lavamentivorans DS-1]